MKTRQTYQHPKCPPGWPAKLAVFLALFSLLTATALAQSVTMRAQPLRITIPKNVASSVTITQTITTAALPTPLVNLAVTGVPASGNATATLSQSLINSNGTTSVVLTFANDATILPGEYDLAVEASGDASFRLPIPVEVVTVWNGASSTAFAANGNWIGGTAPTATDKVVFRDAGGQTSTAITNIVVSADAEVASVRFAPEASATRFHNMEILAGTKLRVTGPGLSFSLHRDTKLAGQRIDTMIAGGGTLEVSNPSGTIGVLVDGQQNATLDMRNLNNFVADVSRIGLGDYRIWPNYYTNGYVGSGGANLANPPTRFVPLVWLAKTNVIKCSWVDPNNYADPGIREYALEIANCEAAGTSTALRFTLGLSNAFFIDSICWTHSGSGASGGQNYNFNAADSYALFRGIGGNRMSVWSQGDSSGNGASGTSVRGQTVNFSLGQVDALIDKLYLGRTRTNSTGFNIQAALTIGGASLGSIFDVNTAFIGAQDQDNQNPAPSSALTGPVGTLTVGSNATFRVNGDLHLGYTVATAVGVPSYPEACRGVLVVNNSGTVMASNILVGGVSKLSVNNSISVDTAGKLIVTNTLGTSDAPVDTLTLANNAELTLLGTTVGQTRVFVKTLSAASACKISVPSIAGYTSGDVTVSLISYVNASPVVSGLTITPPPGLFVKSIVDNSSGFTIDVTFTDRPPLVLVWRGNINNTWNHTDKNWVTQVGGGATNFVDGDSVIFDDTAVGSTTIDVAGPVAPGQTAASFGIVINNTSKNYTLSSGTVIGSATLLKTGPGTLTVNASLTPGILLSQGTLLGAGTIGPSTLADGSTMTGFSGTVNGGLTASNAVVNVTGTVNGGLKLQAGSLANLGIINGSVTLGSNITLINAEGANINVTVPWTVTTNSTLINNGRITQSGPAGQNLGLTVNGLLKGVGVITLGSGASADARVTLGAGGNLVIGNADGEITNLTIAVRLDLLADSRTTIDVDNSTAQNDKIFLTDNFIQGHVNFGAGNNQGCTLVVNKVAGPAFGPGTLLPFFDLTANIPDNAAQAIPGVIPPPAPGLAWDVSRTISNLTVAVQGPAVITNSITTGTNGVKNLVFDWPENYRGWRLERQTNSLAIGLELNSTNWVTVATSLGGSNTTFYPDTNDLSIRFFRSTQAVTDTNGAGLYPATFFRLTYP